MSCWAIGMLLKSEPKVASPNHLELTPSCVSRFHCIAVNFLIHHSMNSLLSFLLRSLTNSCLYIASPGESLVLNTSCSRLLSRPFCLTLCLTLAQHLTLDVSLEDKVLSCPSIPYIDYIYTYDLEQLASTACGHHSERGTHFLAHDLFTSWQLTKTLAQTT